ncbi:porin [Massilia forsythiae]|uniref:Porin n=1 Tax=Massilia forsythiae TaxID=2728020 RepID=A0A7Z2VWX3_9BURK|nr:porin [Massilia forsythiae]QJE00946.1 porin [Massilia forsythiae]
MKKTLMLGLLASAAIRPASAVDIKAGDWTVNVGGNVNAYYTVVRCKGDADGGLALAGRTLGCGGEDHRTTVGNGLLPSGLVTSASTSQGGYDVKALIGIYVATATDSAIAQNSTVDVRQAYFSVGNAGIGSVKLGRDYGIFGSHAILGDMTLLGAGAPVQATQRGRVTLGHIGAGYAYFGHYGQVAYTAPALPHGIGLDVGLMSPVADTPIVAPPRYSARSTPQVQAQLTGAYGPVKGWLGVKSQHFEAAGTTAGNLRMNAVELGASMDAGQAGFLVNLQRGNGLGLLSDADQGDVRSTHYFLQATYKTNERLKLGLNYGKSRNGASGTGTGGLKSNANLTLGAYYALNTAVTLVGELGRTESRAFGGASSHMDGISLGGILFF